MLVEWPSVESSFENQVCASQALNSVVFQLIYIRICSQACQQKSCFNILLRLLRVGPLVITQSSFHNFFNLLIFSSNLASFITRDSLYTALQLSLLLLRHYRWNTSHSFHCHFQPCSQWALRYLHIVHWLVLAGTNWTLLFLLCISKSQNHLLGPSLTLLQSWWTMMLILGNHFDRSTFEGLVLVSIPWHLMGYVANTLSPHRLLDRHLVVSPKKWDRNSGSDNQCGPERSRVSFFII